MAGSSPLSRETSVFTLREASLRHAAHGPLPSGVEALDTLLDGGLPRGRITELTGPASSGKTGLALALLACATRGGELAAYIDPYRVLDPFFALRAGVDPGRLLWVRANPETALKAADILTRAGGFGVVVLDLDPGKKRSPGVRSAYHSWFRLKNAIEGSATVLLVLAKRPAAGSASSLVFSLTRERSVWHSATGSRLAHSRLFRSLSSRIEMLRGKRLRHEKIHCHFER